MIGSRRVVVSGIGLITALGNSLDCSFEAIRQGKTGISRVRKFDASGFSQQCAAEVEDFEPRKYFRVPKAIKITDRKTRLAVAAATMALCDAGLESCTRGPETLDAETSAQLESLGVVMGSGASDLQVEDMARAIGEDPELRSVLDIPFFASKILSGVSPLWLLVNLPNMVSTHIAIQAGARGPNSTVMTDWIASAQAIGEAAMLIETGEADMMLAGGADSGVCALTFASYQQGGMFDVCTGRPAFVPGEAAAVLVLEEQRHAFKRGARIYGEINGYSCASGPVETPETVNGLLLALDGVMQRTGWQTADLDAVCCAAVFSERHWGAERIALENALQRPYHTLPLVEYKSFLGHTLAASGAVDLALLLQSLQDSARPARALCNSLGYCGQAAALAVTVN